MVTERKTIECTQSELDQIRADAAEEARRMAAYRCMQIVAEWGSTIGGGLTAQNANREITKEFGL